MTGPLQPRESETVPLISVHMSADAAEKLAAACRWAEHRAVGEWDDEGLSAEKRHEAMIAYEWLSWGGRWLTSEEGRKDG